MTRYDEITSMDIHELAKFLTDTVDAWKCMMCPYQNNKPTCSGVDCAEIPESLLVQEWLEQEVHTGGKHEE